MKYETPELTALTAPIDAIQSADTSNKILGGVDSTQSSNEGAGAYADWE